MYSTTLCHDSCRPNVHPTHTIPPAPASTPTYPHTIPPHHPQAHQPVSTPTRQHTNPQATSQPSRGRGGYPLSYNQPSSVVLISVVLVVAISVVLVVAISVVLIRCLRGRTSAALLGVDGGRQLSNRIKNFAAGKHRMEVCSSIFVSQHLHLELPRVVVVRLAQLGQLGVSNQRVPDERGHVHSPPLLVSAGHLHVGTIGRRRPAGPPLPSTGPCECTQEICTSAKSSIAHELGKDSPSTCTSVSCHAEQCFKETFGIFDNTIPKSGLEFYRISFHIFTEALDQFTVIDIVYV